MKSHVLVTGAGTGAANNLIRSLKAALPSLVVVGGHHDRFVVTQSAADRNYLLSIDTPARMLRGLRRIVDTEAIDLRLPSTDVEVRTVSQIRGKIPCRVFLPRHSTIERCQDKYRLARFLRQAGVPVPDTYPVTRGAGMAAVFRRLTAAQPLVWCRARHGNGAVGAAPVRTLEQARSWVAYWKDMRGIRERGFTLAQYLPGRDFGCQSLWKGGRLVLIKTFERLSHVVRGSEASRVSSLAALTKMVHEPRVVEVCEEAIRRLDGRASGVFCVDLKEDADGVPCITEINAGRFSMSTNVYDLTGKYNMALAYVQLALGRCDVPPGTYDVVEDHYMVRDLDIPPGVLSADALFDGIIDARGEAAGSADHRSSPKRRT
jgi:biotin carboxylase